MLLNSVVDCMFQTLTKYADLGSTSGDSIFFLSLKRNPGFALSLFTERVSVHVFASNNKRHPVFVPKMQGVTWLARLQDSKDLCLRRSFSGFFGVAVKNPQLPKRLFFF